ncbi:MAG: C4-type zinc ribbon domain-containing protein [Bacteroidales bacterium]
MSIDKSKTNIETPLDGGTFISLQKSSADSDLSMELRLQLLYKLQQIDSKIDKIHLLRGELPLEVQDLEDEISGRETRVNNLAIEIAELEKSIAQQKIALENSKALILSYTEKQNNVKNNREYTSLAKEIEYQGYEVEHSNIKIKEFTEALEEKRGYILQVKGELKEGLSDLEIKKRELDSIKAETAKEEEELLAVAEEVKSQIDARMLAAYQKVRSNARNGLAVVIVKRDSCSGCFNKIPPQRQIDIASSKKIIVCEYCGRILVDSSFASQE